MIRWVSIAFAVVSVSMITVTVHEAITGDGGTGSWVLALVWLLGTLLILGAAARSVLLSPARGRSGPTERS